MTNGNDSINAVVYPGFTYADGSYEPSSSTDGLTKREYFAAMAMQGLLCNASIITGTRESVSVPSLAESATHYADALITELNKNQ